MSAKEASLCPLGLVHSSLVMPRIPKSQRRAKKRCLPTVSMITSPTTESTTPPRVRSTSTLVRQIVGHLQCKALFVVFVCDKVACFSCPAHHLWVFDGCPVQPGVTVILAEQAKLLISCADPRSYQ